MIQKILIAVDGRDADQRILQYGSDLSRALEAKVALVYVTLPPSKYEPPEMVHFKVVEATAVHTGEQILKCYQCSIEGCKEICAFVREGDVAEEIVATARQWNADLIVIGDHNRGTLARLVLGSTSERVLRHAPCPVLVVRSKLGQGCEAAKAATVCATN